jgi:hypothetical protein
MQVVWEAADIKPGNRYGKKGVNEQWIIGYRPELADPLRYVSVSDQDGMVTLPCSKEQMARALTAGDYLPLELL